MKTPGCAVEWEEEYNSVASKPSIHPSSIRLIHQVDRDSEATSSHTSSCNE